MPDFVAFFPSTEAARPPTSFSALEGIFRGPLRAEDVRTDLLRGATLLRTRCGGMSPRIDAREDREGGIEGKGPIFDVRSQSGLADLEGIHNRFLAEELADINR